MARFYINPVDTSESTWLELVAAPGYEVSGDVAVFNGFEDATKFSLAVVDAESTEEEDGFFALKTETANQDGVGLWGSIERQEITIMGGDTEQLTVTFVVPENAELGDYWGGVTAMEVKEIEASEESGLNIAVRNGMRVYLDVMSAEDYEAYLAAQIEEPEDLEAEEEEEPLGEVSYALLFQIGGLVLVLAIIIALLKLLNNRKR